jgi:hypothetical protein
VTCKQRFLRRRSGLCDKRLSQPAPLVRRRSSLRLVSRLRVLVGHAKSSLYLELTTVIYFSESETHVIESASAFNAEREGSLVSSSASETVSEVLSSATHLCAPKELKLKEPSHTGLSGGLWLKIGAWVVRRRTRVGGLRQALIAQSRSVGLRTQKSLFTRHGNVMV